MNREVGIVKSNDLLTMQHKNKFKCARAEILDVSTFKSMEEEFYGW